MQVRQHTVALFGEAERGEYRTVYFFQSLPQLLDNLGNPPEDSQGIHYAVQLLMHQHQLVYFRVEEEGFSTEDYLLGARFLRQSKMIKNLSALFLPGVGCHEIMEEVEPICKLHESLLLTTESDLYDYLTYFQQRVS